MLATALCVGSDQGGLKSLSFGHDFNQSLEGVTFPPALQVLTFGALVAGDFVMCLMPHVSNCHVHCL